MNWKLGMCSLRGRKENYSLASLFAQLVFERMLLSRKNENGYDVFFPKLGNLIEAVGLVNFDHLAANNVRSHDLQSLVDPMAGFDGHPYFSFIIFFFIFLRFLGLHLPKVKIFHGGFERRQQIRDSHLVVLGRFNRFENQSIKCRDGSKTLAAWAGACRRKEKETVLDLLEDGAKKLVGSKLEKVRRKLTHTKSKAGNDANMCVCYA